ncbi:hypothetical protein B0I37DRAFT_172564 [Chaetomium sp. MPI-CAGE-AT-0009]|nr:hypothetical protein B0I37DRAFT_172564 [Chaetomium sp. MPI-CAGE-AT-0009]
MVRRVSRGATVIFGPAWRYRSASSSLSIVALPLRVGCSRHGQAGAKPRQVTWRSRCGGTRPLLRGAQRGGLSIPGAFSLPYVGGKSGGWHRGTQPAPEDWGRGPPRHEQCRLGYAGNSGVPGWYPAGSTFHRAKARRRRAGPPTLASSGKTVEGAVLTREVSPVGGYPGLHCLGGIMALITRSFPGIGRAWKGALRGVTVLFRLCNSSL